MIGFGLWAMMCFTGCKGKLLSENEITESIPENMLYLYIDDKTYAMEMDSFEIEKRKIDEDLDTVYCSVVMKNGLYSVNADCILYYTYYDQGGWILDNWEISNRNVKAVSALPQVETDMEMSRYYFNSYKYVSSDFDEDYQESYSVYDVSYECDNYSYQGQVTLLCWFDGYTWNKSIQYEKGIDWKVDGMWAASQEDMRGRFGNSAFELNILNVDQETGIVKLSATNYYGDDTDSVENIVADRMVVDYTGQDYLTADAYKVVPDEDRIQEMKYGAPTLSFIFEMESGSYSVLIKPYEALLSGGNIHGDLYKGYHIETWVNSFDYMQFDKVYDGV